MIAAMPHDYQISELCAAFDVSRSGYYAHLHKPAGRRRREDEALRPKIAAAFHESRQTYGTPRLRAVLTQQEGTGISRERIARIMREQGLQPLQKRAFIPLLHPDRSRRPRRPSRPLPPRIRCGAAI